MALRKILVPLTGQPAQRSVLAAVGTRFVMWSCLIALMIVSLAQSCLLVQAATVADCACARALTVPVVLQVSLLHRREVMRKEHRVLLGLHELLTYGLKGVAAYAHHAEMLGKVDPDLDNMFEEVCLHVPATDCRARVPATECRNRCCHDGHCQPHEAECVTRQAWSQQTAWCS